MEYQHALFVLQDSLAALSFVELADSLGIPDMEVFTACNDSTEPVPRIEHDIETARSLRASGTPSVIVNGRRPPGGGPTLSELRKIILDTRARATK